MNVGDIVLIEQEGHPYRGQKGKIVGKRGHRPSGDPWCLVYVIIRGRSYLFPESTLKLLDQKTEEEEVYVWPVTGEVMKKSRFILDK